MSDAAIERAYEQDLQAAARYLQVWVTFHLRDGELLSERRKVRTFMDTPEGRGVAAKCADWWFELPRVRGVEVVPVGADGSSGTGSRDPEWARPTGGDAGAHQPKPQGDPAKRASAPTACCTPGFLAKPSGRRFCHSLDCLDQPGEPIPIARQHAQGRNWPPYNRERR